MRYSSEYVTGAEAVIRRQWLHRCPKALFWWRVCWGLSQQQMVDKINEHSPKPITLKTYQRWERGKTQPHLRYYRALQQVIRHYWEAFTPFPITEEHLIWLMEQRLHERVEKHKEEHGGLTEETLIEIAFAELTRSLASGAELHIINLAELYL